MAAGAGGGRRRHLYRGIEPRWSFRPLRSGPARRSHRLARRLLDAGGLVVDGRRHARAVAAAGERLRSLAGHRRFDAPNAAASQGPAAPRHLRHRIRRAVQLHRGVHLRELPSRRGALSLFLDAARRDFRDLSRRHRDLADDRLDAGEAWPAGFPPGRYCGVVGGRGALARAAGSGDHRGADVLRRVRHAVPDDRDRLCHRKGRSSAVGLYVTSFYVGGSMGAFLTGLAWEWGGWPAAVAMVVAMLAAMAVIAALAYRDATA